MEPTRSGAKIFFMTLAIGSGVLSLFAGLGILTGLGGLHLLAPRKGVYTRPLFFDYAPDDRSYQSIFPCECTQASIPPPPSSDLPSTALVPQKFCTPSCAGPVVDTSSGPVALAFFLSHRYLDAGGRVVPGTPPTAGFIKPKKSFNVEIELKMPDHPLNADLFTVHARLLTANGTEVHIQSKSVMRPPTPSLLGALLRLPRRVLMAPLTLLGLVSPPDVVRVRVVEGLQERAGSPFAALEVILRPARSYSTPPRATEAPRGLPLLPQVLQAKAIVRTRMGLLASLLANLRPGISATLLLFCLGAGLSIAGLLLFALAYLISVLIPDGIREPSATAFAPYEASAPSEYSVPATILEEEEEGGETTRELGALATPPPPYPPPRGVPGVLKKGGAPTQVLGAQGPEDVELPPLPPRPPSSIIIEESVEEGEEGPGSARTDGTSLAVVDLEVSHPASVSERDESLGREESSPSRSFQMVGEGGELESEPDVAAAHVDHLPRSPQVVEASDRQIGVTAPATTQRRAGPGPSSRAVALLAGRGGVETTD